MSARMFRKLHGRNSANFLCMLTVAVARSSSGGFAICYVLPVFWMTSFFTQWTLWHVACIPMQRERNSVNDCIYPDQTVFSDKVRRVYNVGCAPGAKSAFYDCLIYDCLPTAVQGGPAKVRPTLLVTFEYAGKIQWFLAIWRTILNTKFLRFPRCVSKLLSHLPKTDEFYLCIQMLPK